MNRSRIAENLAAIRTYTNRHPELRRAHHFLYDLHIRDVEPSVDYIVMGVNPGESKSDWDQAPTPTEETSEYSFLADHGRNRSSRTWIRLCEYFCSTSSVLISEYFFWSSRNIYELVERFGPLHASPHLAFCARLNRDLIEIYGPKAVISPGLKILEGPIPSLYRLTLVDVLSAKSGRRLVVHYTDGEIPWLFTKHWTGAFGFSTDEREFVRQYIRLASGSEAR